MCTLFIYCSVSKGCSSGCEEWENCGPGAQAGAGGTGAQPPPGPPGHLPTWRSGLSSDSSSSLPLSRVTSHQCPHPAPAAILLLGSHSLRCSLKILWAPRGQRPVSFVFVTMRSRTRRLCQCLQVGIVPGQHWVVDAGKAGWTEGRGSCQDSFPHECWWHARHLLRQGGALV